MPVEMRMGGSPSSGIRLRELPTGLAVGAPVPQAVYSSGKKHKFMTATYHACLRISTTIGNEPMPEKKLHIRDALKQFIELEWNKVNCHLRSIGS